MPYQEYATCFSCSLVSQLRMQRVLHWGSRRVFGVTERSDPPGVQRGSGIGYPCRIEGVQLSLPGACHWRKYSELQVTPRPARDSSRGLALADRSLYSRRRGRSTARSRWDISGMVALPSSAASAAEEPAAAAESRERSPTGTRAG